MDGHERDGYRIGTDGAHIDVDVVWRFLAQSYWAQGVSRETVVASIEGSLCFGLYAPGGEQVGFARVVSDGATFAWVADVFVLPAHRGRGLGKLLIRTVLADPRLQGLRRWMLGTADAHGLYTRYGFAPVPEPSRFLTRSGLRQSP